MWGSAPRMEPELNLQPPDRGWCLLMCHWAVIHSDLGPIPTAVLPVLQTKPQPSAKQPVRHWNLPFHGSGFLLHCRLNAGLGPFPLPLPLSLFFLRSRASPLRPHPSRQPRHCLSLARSLPCSTRIHRKQRCRQKKKNHPWSLKPKSTNPISTAFP